MKDYPNVAELPSAGTNGVIRARLPYNAQVTPYLRVTAPAGAVIRMQTDLHGEGPTVRAEYTTRDGEQEYESFGWMNGHSVEYTIPSSVRIQSLRYRETGFDTDFSGSFRSNDAELNTFWTKALRTLYLNMRDNYMDASAIRAVYPTVRRYLALWSRSSDGLVQHRAGDWDWADWGNNIDVTVLENVWYYMALDGAVRMAELAGQASEAMAYRARMAELKPAFLARFWNGTELRTPGRSGAVDERGHGLAVVAGLLGPNEWPAVRSVLQRATESGPYMEKYVLEAFFVMNDARGGLARMRQRFRTMIQSPLTTLWEVWVPGDPVVPVEGGGTVNHAWTGGPLTLLSQYVAGIAPTQPGYAEFEVLPQLGDLTQVTASVPSKKGAISVDVQRGPPFAVKVSVPPATRATVGVPVAAVTSQTLGRARGHRRRCRRLQRRKRQTRCQRFVRGRRGRLREVRVHGRNARALGA